jgi:hypothetical protein
MGLVSIIQESGATLDSIGTTRDGRAKSMAEMMRKTLAAARKHAICPDLVRTATHAGISAAMMGVAGHAACRTNGIIVADGHPRTAGGANQSFRNNFGSRKGEN